MFAPLSYLPPPTSFWGGYAFARVPLGVCRYYQGAGVYVLVHRDHLDIDHALYIGEADDLGQRLRPSHHKWYAAVGLGLNEVHIHITPGTSNDRLALETVLRNRYPTPLNAQGSGLNRLADVFSDRPIANGLLGLGAGLRGFGR